ncbi:Endochitinase 3 [Quillaja saponaria]|uniref:Endochitinase 3 n=1 Tax=Quillaja saponaria TaxID=32244 RepID=A0AAD7QBW9_QUISA|nr:Endochitinase 3 [Quillaja saponaria]
MGGVAQHLNIAAPIAGVNAAAEEVVVILEVSSQGPHLIICLNIVMMVHALLKGSTPTMLSFLQQRPFPPSAPPAILPPGKGRLPPSLAKLPTKLPGDGQVHLMVHMPGDIVMLGNKTQVLTVILAPQLIHVLLGSNIMVEGPSKFPRTTTTDNVEEQLEWTYRTTQI